MAGALDGGAVVAGALDGGAVVAGVVVADGGVGAASAVGAATSSKPQTTMLARAARGTAEATGGPRAVRRAAGPTGLTLVLYMSSVWRNGSVGRKRGGGACRRRHVDTIVVATGAAVVVDAAKAGRN